MIGENKPAVLRSGGIAYWRGESRRLRVRFTGRAPGASKPSRDKVLEHFPEVPRRVAWLKQCHSATVVRADQGSCGSADALWTQAPRLTLSIVTADCVPIVCGGEGVVAAIHAGWRGLVEGVIRSTLAELPVPPRRLEAWLGPAIGRCCYEVDWDVAEKVVSAAEPGVATPGDSGKPHLDLHRAAESQLRDLGIESVHRVEVCTRCNPGALWSYRGSAGANGRNHTFAWLDDR